MDLISFMRYETLLIVPFVVYYLFFKTNAGRSAYSDRDIFYPIKCYFAKKVIRSIQKNQRTRTKREKSKEDELEFPSNQFSHYQCYHGADQKGNGLSLKFTVRSNKTAEIFLVLRLANGKVYSYPGAEKVRIASVKENQFKVNGLTVETLESFKRVRIVFNGLLRDISCRSYDKVEHVQFNFIFNCCASPRFFPADVEENLLIETLATRPWNDASWKKFLSDQAEGYEQFGSLLGFVKGDIFPEETVLNLPCCRSRYSGIADSHSVDREVRIFLAERDGALINLILKSFGEGSSQLNYGYVTHLHNITDPIVGQDIRISYVGRNKSLPDAFVAHVHTKVKEYKCVFHLNKDLICPSESAKLGYEIINAYAECDINASQGRALLEFTYYEQSDVNQQKLRPLLREKKVDALPDVFIADIKSEEARILELTGGKGNSLALLSSLESDEFSVPDGFVVTVNAFRRQLEVTPKLQTLLTALDEVFCGRKDGVPEEACQEVLLAFHDESISPEIVTPLLKNLRRMKAEEPEAVSWAIRSSAIGEDSEELSAAGQNETFLGCVTEEQVLKGVSACWGSLFTYQSVQYRWQHGLPVISDMAVVVQKMVPAESAGVLFTWHPTSSNPSQMVVTSNFGLGESVVSGKSDPDTFILNRTFDGKICLLDQIIGTKNKVVTLTRDGVEEVAANEDGWSISKEQAIKLGRVGLALEEAFGGPRDIEWAFHKDELYLLQSRPITTLNSWSEFELTRECDSAILTESNVVTLANTGEVFPGATTVLSQSSSLVCTDRGIQKHIYKTVEKLAHKTVSAFQHRVMVDVIISIHKNAKKTVQMSSRILDLAIFGHQVMNEKINQIVLNRLGEVRSLKLAKESLRLWYWARKGEMVRDQAAEFSKSLDFKIKDDDGSKEIYDKIDNKLEELAKAGYLHAINTGSSVFYQIIAMNILVQTSLELTMEHYADFALILSSCEDVVSAEVPMYLERIARIIRDEGYDEEFCTIKPEFGVAWLKSKCPEAGKVFDEFLDRHGHRNLGEFEMMEESWAMNPSKVIPMIQANAKQDRSISKIVLSVDEVVSKLVSPVNAVTKKILKYAISNLRRAVGNREQTKSELIRSLNKLRMAYRKLAKAMVAKGLLPAENLMFHLTHQELGTVIDKRSPLLVSKAAKRQRLYSKWSKTKYPELIFGIPEPEKDSDCVMELVTGSVCTGTPVCMGSVKARACVITSLEEIGQLETSDILITYSTDIGWSPYFPMLSGVVTELGGLVSHGAVVAREYGLPCIVGVKNVTKLFKTGDIVYLSGKTGELAKV
ncbi:prodigiosin synthesizing transferase PigC-like isoform X2 [Cylas formicarius]|uniref:prodigiosin synthesizing transferase PigC-like isoform X2 n=1 Tax=Cylas formicarius TaxID=197179 RepID=UPI0029587874|nr:prodigiosin synthesizing transferase PigC-like isoform X2 [Cylas formicarius]